MITFEMLELGDIVYRKAGNTVIQYIKIDDEYADSEVYIDSIQYIIPIFSFYSHIFFIYKIEVDEYSSYNLRNNKFI